MVILDTLPLGNGHSSRGIGYYVTGLLTSIARALETEPPHPDVRLLATSSVSSTNSRLKEVLTWRPARPRNRLSWAINATLVNYDFRNVGSAQLFHGTDPSGMCRPRGVRMLATAYDLIPLRYPKDYLHRYRLDERLGYSAMLRRYRSAEMILAISNATRKDFCDYLGISPEKIVVIYPSIDVGAMTTRFGIASSDEAATDFPDRYFLYVGALDPRKNIEAALRAYAAVSSHLEEDFVIAGKLAEAEREELEGLISRYGLGSRVRYLGKVTDARLGLLYRGATALVFMSRFEGFGLPLLEAMALRCPVICSNGGALEEVASDAAAVVPLDDDVALENALVRVATDIEYRQALADKGENRARDFDHRRAGLELLNLYQTLLS